MNDGPGESGGLREELAKGSVEIRCAGGCGRLIHKTSWGAIDPLKLWVRCQKCEKNLMAGDWQILRGEAPVTIFIYRCANCNLIYEKVFYGSERLCKGCKISHMVFVATNGDPPQVIEGRGTA